MYVMCPPTLFVGKFEAGYWILGELGWTFHRTVALNTQQQHINTSLPSGINTSAPKYTNIHDSIIGGEGAVCVWSDLIILEEIPASGG
jgi:hypothetical protein